MQIAQTLRNLFKPVARPNISDAYRDLRDCIESAGEALHQGPPADPTFLAEKAGRLLTEQGESAGTLQIEAFSMEAGFRPIRIIIQPKSETSPVECAIIWHQKFTDLSEQLATIVHACRQAVAHAAIALDDQSPLEICDQLKGEMKAICEEIGPQKADTVIRAAWVMLEEFEEERKG